MNAPVIRPAFADKIPPTEPNLAQLIVEAMRADQAVTGVYAGPCDEAAIDDAEDRQMFAREALLTKFETLGVDRDLARKIGDVL